MKVSPDFVRSFSKASIMVIGDLILDKFIWGKVDRISPEAPVPVVTQQRFSVMPGGASNVANNLSSLGAGKVFMVGMVGRDEEGEKLKAELKNRGINVAGIITETARPTTVKTRIIAHHQQVVRLDQEEARPLNVATIDRIAGFVENNIDKCDALIIEDYGKGVICPQVLEPIVSIALKKKKLITVDPKEDHFKFYKNVTAITPNLKEATIAWAGKIGSDQDIDRMGKELLKKLNLSALLITMGERGMRLFKKGTSPRHIDTVAREVFDVSGAGDTVIAAFTLGLSVGADFYSAAYVSNVCAGIVVAKVGVATVNSQELLKELKENHG